jgi:hypothetical protein
MRKIMIQQWQSLLTQLEVINEEQEIFSAENLSTFEQNTGILLPASYKEYCQVFGTGIFRGIMTIFCPSDSLLEYSALSIEALQENLELFPSEDTERDSNLRSLLDHSLVFGDDRGANIAVWDLRTYSDIDQSYDIYWVSIDADDPVLYRINRDFYEFISDFCIRTTLHEALPDEKRPGELDAELTFVRFRAN